MVLLTLWQSKNIFFTSLHHLRQVHSLQPKLQKVPATNIIYMASEQVKQEYNCSRKRRELNMWLHNNFWRCKALGSLPTLYSFGVIRSVQVLGCTYKSTLMILPSRRPHIIPVISEICNMAQGGWNAWIPIDHFSRKYRGYVLQVPLYRRKKKKPRNCTNLFEYQVQTASTPLQNIRSFDQSNPLNTKKQ